MTNRPLRQGIAALLGLTACIAAAPALRAQDTTPATPSTSGTPADRTPATRASERQIALTRQLMSLSDPFGKLLEQLSPQVVNSLTNEYHKAGKSADKRAVEAFVAEFNKEMTPRFEKLVDHFMPTLATSFTEEELQALVDFYSSPVGRSVMKKYPAYIGTLVQRMMPFIQQQIPQALGQARATLKAQGIEIPD